MFNPIVIVLDVFVTLFSQSMRITIRIGIFHLEEANMSIQILAERYNYFQHDFGQNVDHDYDDLICTLFTADFKKIANGNELACERSQLLKQLKSAKEFAGTWSIQSLEIIPSADEAKCTIRYFLNSENAGQFEVIAILSAKQNLIHRIDEIYYQKAE